MMDDLIAMRCVETARFMLEKRATVRQAARAFSLSKSTVHKDMALRLPAIDAALAQRVAALMQFNKAVRHLRGGEATRRRYQAKSAGTNG